MAWFKHPTRKQRQAFADDVRRLGLPIDERYPDRFIGGWRGRPTRKQKRSFRLGNYLPLGKRARLKRKEEDVEFLAAPSPREGT